MITDLRSPRAEPLTTLCALVRGDAAPPLPPDTDWASLVTLAQAHGIGPLLLRALQGYGAAIPADWLARLQSERTEIAVQHMLAARMQRRLASAMGDADIRCVWLKGIVLAHTVYPEPALRPMVDVDVLVPYAQRRGALAVAEAAGFRLDRRQLFDGRDGLKHHYLLYNDRYRPVSLELHYRLLGPLDKLLTVNDQAWFWDHAQTLARKDGADLVVLRPEAHLLYLCAHALLQHGEADLRLIHLYDVDRLLAAHPEFDWGLLVDAAERLRWTYAVERTLALAQAAFQTQAPTAVMAELAARRPRAERPERAVRRQRSLTTTQTVLDDLAAMNWSSRVRAAGRILAPPPSYMRWRYGLESNRGLPGAYARRARRIAADALHSVRKGKPRT